MSFMHLAIALLILRISADLPRRSTAVVASNVDLATQCKLGGFHTLMSFLGSIGHLMDGSGLTEILDTIYAENTTPHLLSGKAISRAVRGFVIIESALHVLLHREQLSMEKDSEVTYST